MKLETWIDTTTPVALIMAIGCLMVIAYRLRQRAEALKWEAHSTEAEADDIDCGPEPAPAEIEQAERSIRAKYKQEVRRSWQMLGYSLLSLGVTACICVPFLANMPFHGYFRPWGQVAVFICGLFYFAALFAGVRVFLARMMQRQMEDFLKSESDLRR